MATISLLLVVRPLTRFLRTIVLGGAVLALGLTVLAPVAKAFAGSWSTVKGDRLAEMTELSERSVVQRRDGSTLAVLHADENRAPVKLAQVPEIVINAVIGVEDDRFWKHHGVDLRGTVRALATNVAAGEVRQGGSTITQQLVKNSLLTPEKTVDRKVREALLAWRLEDHTTQEGDPRALPQHRLFRQRRLRRAGRGRGVLRQEGDRTQRGRRGPARRHSSATRSATTRSSSRRVRRAAPGRRRTGWWLGRAQPEPRRQTCPRHAAADEGREPRDRDQRLLRRRGQAGAARRPPPGRDRAGALQRGVQGRPADRHHARPRRVGGGAEGRRRHPARHQRQVHRRAGVDRAVDRRGARHRRRQGLRVDASSTSRPRPTASPARRSRPWCWWPRSSEGYGPDTIVNGTSPCTVQFPGHAPYTPENYEGEGGGLDHADRRPRRTR